jgi:hypothetical protein
MPTDAAWNRRREAARKYRPNRIRLLVVAESPPAEPERYFYFEDADSHDELFDALCEVLFEAAPAGEKAPYLKELKRRGVYVTELKPDAPRDGESLAPYIAPFALNLYDLAPERIVLVSADVYAAYGPLKKDGHPVVDVRIPAPSAKDGVKFRQAFRQALVRAELEKLIRKPPAPKA